MIAVSVTWGSLGPAPRGRSGTGTWGSQGAVVVGSSHSWVSRALPVESLSSGRVGHGRLPRTSGISPAAEPGLTEHCEFPAECGDRPRAVWSGTMDTELEAWPELRVGGQPPPRRPSPHPAPAPCEEARRTESPLGLALGLSSSATLLWDPLAGGTLPPSAPPPFMHPTCPVSV